MQGDLGGGNEGLAAAEYHVLLHLIEILILIESNIPLLVSFPLFALSCASNPEVSMQPYNLVSFAGVFALLGVAWLLSSNRKRANARVVIWGVLLQFIMGAVVFLLPAGSRVLLEMSRAVVFVLGAAQEGVLFCFGSLAIPPGQEGSLGFNLVFQALPIIVFFSSLMAILYHLKVMPWVIKQFSRLFTKLMRVSGAESLCAASNIFVGIESATTVLPYLKKMTRSEFCTVLTAGMATIASSVLGLYVLLLKPQFPDIAAHLISASLLSAPAALVMSKILLPETEEPETLGVDVAQHYERDASVIEAAIKGATAGGKLVMGIIVMLLAFLGIVALVNAGFDLLGRGLSQVAGRDIAFQLQDLFAYVFYPFALMIGVPIVDAFDVARLLGERVVLTEVPAYQHLAELIAADSFVHARSGVLASYALCGFAHVAAIAIFVGGIAALVPERTQTLSQVAFRALLAATFACLLTAAVAGTFYGSGSLFLN